MSKSRRKLMTVLLSCVFAVSALLVPVGALASSSRTTYTVSPAKRYQQVDGWGTSLIWWAGQIGGYDWESDDGREVREQIMDLIYGSDGLDFNIARYNVAGGENPDCEYKGGSASHMDRGREMEGFKASEYSDYDWSADANQRWALDWIQENVNDAVVEYFSNSPPWWMTVSGCVSGAADGMANLKEGYEAKFAEYFVDVLEHLIKDEGVDVHYIDPFNESTSTWWPAGGKQEGCYMTDAQRSAVLSEVARLVAERGLDVAVTGTDCTNAESLLKAWAGLSEEAKDTISKLNYHMYGENDTDGVKNRYEVRRLANEQGKSVWMSEMGYNMEDGLDAVPMTTAFRHSSQIRSVLRDGGASAYVLWQIVEELSTQLGTSSNYGPIKVSFYSNEEAPDLARYGYDVGSYTLDKQYYILGQYSKYIKAGYRITETSDGNALAAVSPDGSKVVIVTENDSASSKRLTYQLDGYTVNGAEVVYTDRTHNWASKSYAASGSSFDVNVTPYSVTTVVLDTAPQKAARDFVDESAAAVYDAEAGLPEENRFYYSGDDTWGIDANSGSANAKYHCERYGNDGASVRMKFTGTGVEVMGAKKSDACEALKVYIDDELVATQNLKQATTANPTTVYAVNGLEYGEHVLRLEPTQGYFNLDGAFVVKGPDAESGQEIALTNVAAANGALGVNFEAPEGSYAVEYRAADETEWHSAAVTASPVNGAYTVKAAEGLTGSEYSVRVVSADGGVLTSATRTVAMAERGDLLYYVNCNSDANAFTDYERAGVWNSEKDAEFHTDAVTGKQWGRTSAGNALYEYNAVLADPYKALESFVSVDGNTDKCIEYKFQVDAGKTYDVALGGLQQWGSRVANVSVNGVAAAEFTIETQMSFCTITGVSPADGFITIRLKEKSGGGSVLNMIAITENGSPAAFIATAEAMEQSGSQITSKGGNVDFTYGDDVQLANKKAYVYLTDGTVRQLDADYTMTIANGGVTASAGTLEGRVTDVSVRGAALLGVSATVRFLSTTSEDYYRIDCGTDGTKPMTLGTKQAAGEYDKAYSDGSWGYTATVNSGPYWENDVYTSSIREFVGYYTLIGFAPNEALKVTVAANVHGWDARVCTVSANGVKLGDIAASGDGVCLGEYETHADAAGNLKLDIAKNGNQNPLLAYIIVSTSGNAAEKPAAPKWGKTETYAQDTVQLTGLVTGANVLLTDDNGRLLHSFVASSATKQIDLSTLDLTGVSYLRAFQRISAAVEDSDAAALYLPAVQYTGITAAWAEKNVLHFMPTPGVTVAKLVVTDPDGKVTDVTSREYFYYRAVKNGVYTVELTTSAGSTVTQRLTVSKVDEVSFSAVRSTEEWTAGDVTVEVSLAAESGVTAVTIDGEEKPVAASYTLTATGNKTFDIRFTTGAGRELTYSVTVDNIDKAAPEVALSADSTFTGGLKLDLSVAAVSGGTLTVTRDGKTETVFGDSYYLAAAGEYTFRFVNALQKEVTKKVNFAYDAAQLNWISAELSGGTLTASAEGATLKIAELGKAAEAFTGTAELSAGRKYLLTAENGDRLEAFLIEMPDTTSGGGGTTSDSSGTASIVGISVGSALIGLSVIGGALMLVVALRRRRG